MKNMIMNTIKLALLFIFLLVFSNVSAKDISVYNIFFEDIEGNQIKLDNYSDNLILIVNTASSCGFTKQYKGLQVLWEQYRNKGLVVLALPSNDFNQEPGNNESIKEFCEVNYGITFPIMSKVKVKGENKHAFFNWIEKNYGKNNLPKWNFFKYLLIKEGKLVNVYSSRMSPGSDEFIKIIEKNL